MIIVLVSPARDAKRLLRQLRPRGRSALGRGRRRRSPHNVRPRWMDLVPGRSGCPVLCATRKGEHYSITVSNRHQYHHNSRQTDEPVRAPFLAADTVVNEEQSVRIVFFLHRPQSRIIGPEESLLPVDIEIVGFRNIGSAVWCDFPQCVARLPGSSGVLARHGEARILPSDKILIGGGITSRDDRKRKRIKRGGV